MFSFHFHRIPVHVEWWFWLTGILLGGGAHAKDLEAWKFVGIWCAVVFVSILLHELGHAYAGRHFGLQPSIRLHGFGGVTYLSWGRQLSRRDNIIVTAAGPAAGLALGGAVWLADRYGNLPDSIHLTVTVRYLIHVNIFWSLMNLLPILPMDGGKIFSDLAGPNRIRLTETVSLIVALVVAGWALQHRHFFMMAMFLYFAWMNFKGDDIEGSVIRSR